MKIALIQQKYCGSKKKTVKKTVEMINTAKEKKAELVVLQELHQTNYFCINENIKSFLLAYDFEKDYEFWRKKSFGIILIVSLFEKKCKGIYYNTAIVFENGKELADTEKSIFLMIPVFMKNFILRPGIWDLNLSKQLWEN